MPIGDQAERVSPRSQLVSVRVPIGTGSPHFHVLLQLVSHLMKTVFHMDTHMQTIDEA